MYVAYNDGDVLLVGLKTGRPQVLPDFFYCRLVGRVGTTQSSLPNRLLQQIVSDWYVDCLGVDSFFLILLIVCFLAPIAFIIVFGVLQNVVQAHSTGIRGGVILVNEEIGEWYFGALVWTMIAKLLTWGFPDSLITINQFLSLVVHHHHLVAWKRDECVAFGKVYAYLTFEVICTNPFVQKRLGSSKLVGILIGLSFVRGFNTYYLANAAISDGIEHPVCCCPMALLDSFGRNDTQAANHIIAILWQVCITFGRVL